MLDRLDDVPWKSLHHAYGSAEDVPELLRDLARSDGRQEKALYALFGNILHQGTVYEASSHAVPFLVELAAEPTIARRDEILGLLGALAEGQSYLAAHARSGHSFSDYHRQKPDFEERLASELRDVERTRLAVFERRDVFLSLLNDQLSMVRAGAAYVLSRFPEHASELGPRLRETTKDEQESLARAGMLWCLGDLQDDTPEAAALLTSAIRDCTDPRQSFAAAVALYQITGQPSSDAASLYRQLAAAKWVADGFLAGVPWDWSLREAVEPLLAEIKPDPTGATRTLLTLLSQSDAPYYAYPDIVHDLLELNFAGGNWRDSTQLTEIQRDVLHRIVETDAAWKDTKRLWFLVRGRAKRITDTTPVDIERARDDMRDVLAGRSTNGAIRAFRRFFRRGR
jgi:hypothetical protein